MEIITSGCCRVSQDEITESSIIFISNHCQEFSSASILLCQIFRLHAGLNFWRRMLRINVSFPDGYNYIWHEFYVNEPHFCSFFSSAFVSILATIITVIVGRFPRFHLYFDNNKTNNNNNT